MADFIELNDMTFQSRLAETQNGIVLFYKKLCPHCKNMEKVLEKFLVRSAEGEIMKVDSELCPMAMASFKVDRVPTLVIIKKGHLADKKTGLMNVKDLIAFYENA
jgi:thioredoxin 1